ncbi:hypothetical protein SALB_04302 [Streptomyces noursei]|uniref:Uncharacterized protein n=1 Tax=Streptomyces noursei TaxID=1971 RepID=A0A401R1R7_STRNR|nr:hypothetical protein SALB_04302 [Streptomyces noursei]
MPRMRNPNSPHSRFRDQIVLPLVHELPIPDMPEGREWTDFERALWADLWCTSQAYVWDDSTEHAVATLVVYWSAILSGTASNTQHMEYRHLSESLGLTPKGMKTLGWVIADE